jgi:hypothetical protein
MRRKPIFMTSAGCIAGALIGAAAGAISVAALRSLHGGSFLLFDGAWLGAAFVLPLGGAAGLFIAVDGKTSR